MSTTRLRWGVVSTANIGRALVNPAIRASRNGTLQAVGSRDAGRAESFARAGGFAAHHGSYEALLTDSDVDAVYIPLPNALHRRWTIAAAEHGKDVLCEKPLALTASEAREMTAAARANDVLLMEAFMYRFHPRTEAMVRLVREGAVGSLRSIRSTFTFRLKRAADIRLSAALGGGALMDVGCYCVNASRTIAGNEPVEVQAWATWGGDGVDTELAGALRFADGLVARFDCALTMDRCEALQVAGTDGHLTSAAAFVANLQGVSLVHVRGPDVQALPFAGVHQYQLMVEHFADCALARRRGETPTLRYTGDEAAANMAVIEALYRSARAGGRPEPVAP